MLMNSREIWKSLQCAPQFARVSQPHMPLKSGFPSAVRGVGAVMSGLPSAVRGTPGVGYSSHWAEAAAGSAITKAAKYVRRNPTGIAWSSLLSDVIPRGATAGYGWLKNGSGSARRDPSASALPQLLECDVHVDHRARQRRAAVLHVRQQ